MGDCGVGRVGYTIHSRVLCGNARISLEVRTLEWVCMCACLYVCMCVCVCVGGYLFLGMNVGVGVDV